MPRIYKKKVTEEGVTGRRGELILRTDWHPKELSALRIKINPDGSIKIPKYTISKKGLKLKNFVQLKNFSTAIRQAFHQLESIENNKIKIIHVWKQLAGIHEEIIENWKSFNPIQKKSTIEFIENSLLKSLKPKKGKTKNIHKINAINRLTKTINLLKKENYSAALTSMVGASNDLIERLNELTAQEKGIERRKKSLSKTKFKRDKSVFNSLDEINSLLGELFNAKTIDEIKKLSNKPKVIAKKIELKNETALKQIKVLLNKTKQTLAQGEKTKSIALIKKTIKTTLFFSSKETRLFKDRLELISKFETGEFQQKIVANQLHFFINNLDYWLSKATPKQKIEMKKHLIDLKNTLSKSNPFGVKSKIVKATRLFYLEKFEESKQELTIALHNLEVSSV